MLDKGDEAVVDGRFNQCLLGRKVAVQRSGTYPGSSRDFVEGDGESVRGEGVGRDLDQAVSVAAGVGTQRLRCRQGAAPVHR